jgi:hypothetical protein
MPIAIPQGISCPIPGLGGRGVSLTLPGGATIGALLNQDYASEQDVVRQLLAYAQLALAPLKPMFDILAALFAIIEILNTVPDIVTNPSKFLKAMKNAAKKFAALAQLLPQISVPIFAGHVIDLLIKVLQGFLVELDAIALKEQDIVDLENKILSASDPLAQVVDCARKINRLKMCMLDEQMAGMTPFFDLLNLISSLAGLPSIAMVGALGHDVFGARSSVATLIQTLQLVRKSIPTPPLQFLSRC